MIRIYKKKWNLLLPLGETLFRTMTAIIFLYTAGKVLEWQGYTGNIFTQTYGLLVIGWAVLPFLRVIIQGEEE